MPVSAPLVRRGRILVVDDEPMIGKLAVRCLEAEHDVSTTEDATAALARITRGERFDVILCDLMMPIMTGFEFHEALQAVAPDQAESMVFLTGGAFTPKTRSFLAEVPNKRLEKPFRIGTLRAVVNERLRGNRDLKRLEHR
jgi:CheY-like chemotaxis protein